MRALRPIAPDHRLVPLDEAERRRHKRRNLVHSLLLLGGIAALAALCGWLLFGTQGMVGLGLGMAAALAFAPRIAPDMVLRGYGARKLRPDDAPELFLVVERLCRRAGIARHPTLHYLASRVPNAFAVGSRDEAAIAVSDGLLRRLAPREVVGVLAHEISHIRNNDLWLMSLADLAGRITRTMSLFGLFVVALGLPMWLVTGEGPPLLLIPLLVFAPQITLLMQLALSRAREFDADLDAAGLTGDPDALSSALARLDDQRRGFFERLLMPGYREPAPSLLRTHPPTAERIARLRALSAGARTPSTVLPRPDPAAWRGTLGPAVDRSPRLRVLGFWH
jgi:heat shock protein HtpX